MFGVLELFALIFIRMASSRQLSTYLTCISNRMVYFSTKLSLGAQRVNDDDDRHTTTYYYVLIMIMITMMKYVGRQLGRHTPDCSALCESRTRIIQIMYHPIFTQHTHDTGLSNHSTYAPGISLQLHSLTQQKISYNMSGILKTSPLTLI